MSEIIPASIRNFTNLLSVYCWLRYSRTRSIASFLDNFNLFWKGWYIPFQWLNHSLGTIFLTDSIPNKDVCWTNHRLKNIHEEFFDVIFGHPLLDFMSPPWFVPWYTTMDYSGSSFCFGSAIFFLFDFCLFFLFLFW